MKRSFLSKVTLPLPHDVRVLRIMREAVGVAAVGGAEIYGHDDTVTELRCVEMLSFIPVLVQRDCKSLNDVVLNSRSISSFSITSHDEMSDLLSTGVPDGPGNLTSGGHDSRGLLGKDWSGAGGKQARRRGRRRVLATLLLHLVLRKRRAHHALLLGRVGVEVYAGGIRPRQRLV